MADPAYADASTITDCYATAEAENPGISIDVNLGATTQLTSSDLDAVFDKVAELHTDATLDLSYNTAGGYAMKSAMDCIFDAGHLTVSSIWTNEHEAQLAARNYTVIVMEGGTPTGELEFEHLETFDGETFIRFQPVQGPWECARAKATPLGTHDYFALVTSMWVKCLNGECGGRCTYSSESANCGCTSANSCSTVWSPGDPSNGAILKFIDPTSW